ncbi:MAG: phenylacetic acid degradation operon negative regulatory protein [Candidatus Berkelbacteria bacterium Athens1014_28]|uniref:Phenylacetic acid degradation operon negative regulatory protein n=1 Tax=Candidatus Berkelbacteria bacterium Athens1014_28 TaxID=2017145 RepID=A0A554LPM1_9BACT|nr:MAG: phenylacetic acid degradation operon negative regulatory protein [Candidatus Berkelbacteria bacterium Athens1014_28]
MVKKLRKDKIKNVGKTTARVAGEITLTLLQIVARTPEALIDAFLSGKSRKSIFDVPEFCSDRLFEYLRDLIERDYVNIVIRNGQKSIELTNKGKIKLLEDTTGNITDGKWRMLSFDIPEDMRNQRDQFRRSIKRIGFKQVQKSLWASPYVKADQVELIINEHNIRKYVAYLIVEKTDIDFFLQKLFE